MTFRVVRHKRISSLPCILYYHGGCFVSGGFRLMTPATAAGTESGYKVIAIQYRLAPEFYLPAAHDDAERGNIVHQYARSS